MAISTYLSIITLNVNELNSLIKTNRVVEWIKKKQKTKPKTHLYAASKRLTLDADTQKLKVRGWKKIFHANGNQKKAGMAKLI